jgi:uncharacterized protein
MSVTTSSVSDSSHTLRPSRYNFVVRHGSDLLIYNSLTASFVILSPPLAEDAAKLLEDPPGTVALDGDLSKYLAEQGILVSSDIDEKAFVTSMERLYKNRKNALRLILMPTEKCLFRCTYCYEEFKNGRMPASVVNGIVQLVQRESSELNRLTIDWFGGEPLAALNVITEISDRLIRICDASEIAYSSAMTTNGFLLTDDVATQLFKMRVRRFQITIDGPREIHNKQRMLVNGRGTFDTIIENLESLKRRADDFQVRLRVNYTPEIVGKLGEFLEFLGSRFGNDSRFSIQFHPVGKWGGPHDEELQTCDAESAEKMETEFAGASTDAGFTLETWRGAMQPFGSSCYAADPRSYVIGSDGSVYKCTVALREPENLVGHLNEDGDLQLDDTRMRTWVASGAEADHACQSCSLRPACHGDACPLARLHNGGQRACPPLKSNIMHMLPIIAISGRRPSVRAT